MRFWKDVGTVVLIIAGGWAGEWVSSRLTGWEVEEGGALVIMVALSYLMLARRIEKCEGDG